MSWSKLLLLSLPPFHQHSAAYGQFPATTIQDIRHVKPRVNPSDNLATFRNMKITITKSIDQLHIKGTKNIIFVKITSVILEEWQSAQIYPSTFDASRGAVEEMMEASSVDLQSSSLEAAAASE